MSPFLRRSVALMAAAVSVSALAACGSSDDPATPATGAADRRGGPIPALSPDDQVSITWESYNLASKATGADTITALVKGFEAEHPNITVTAQAPSNPADIVGSVHREVVAGHPPDVGQLTFDALDFIADDLKAQDLTDMVGQQAITADFDTKPEFQERARTLGVLDGQTYGIPFVFSTPVLFYNADVFRQAGLDPDKPPTTWDEVQAAGQQIAAQTGLGGINLGCFVNAPNGDWCLQGIIRSNGGNVMSADRKQLTWDQPASVAAIAALQQLVKSGAATNETDADALDEFSRGKLGMYLQTSVRQATLMQAAQDSGFELRAAQLPGFGSTPSVPTHSGSALFVFSQDEQKQAAAWELIKYLTGPEAETLISRDIGYLPMRPGLMDDPKYLKAWADKQRDVITPNLQQFERLEPWRAFPGTQYTQIQAALVGAADDVIYHGADPASTLTEAQEQAEGMMPNG